MSTCYVTIYYGPIETFNLNTEHKPQHLAGLRLKLQKLGYRVDLVPVEYINFCMLAICGYSVFRCNIKSLRFNTPAELDPVCLNAIDAVVEANTKLNRTRSYLWIYKMVVRQIFKCTEFASAHWIDNLPPLPPQLADFRKCIQECCKVLTTRDKNISQAEIERLGPIEEFCKEINKTYTKPIDYLGYELENDMHSEEISASKILDRSKWSERQSESEDEEEEPAVTFQRVSEEFGDSKQYKD